jgi:hypothetical protein
MLGDEFRKARSRCIDYNGQAVCLYDEISLPERCRLILTFEGSASEWRQGVRIGDMSAKTDLELTVNGQTALGMKIWMDNSPPQVEVTVRAPKGKLYVYNIWDRGNGQASSQLLGAGMLIQEHEQGRLRRYRCNEGHPTPTFTHLVFSIQICDPISAQDQA